MFLDFLILIFLGVQVSSLPGFFLLGLVSGVSPKIAVEDGVSLVDKGHLFSVEIISIEHRNEYRPERREIVVPANLVRLRGLTLERRKAGRDLLVFRKWAF